MKVAFQLDKQINISFMPENENETNTIKELIRCMGSLPRRAWMVPSAYLDPVVRFEIDDGYTESITTKKSPKKNRKPA